MIECIFNFKIADPNANCKYKNFNWTSIMQKNLMPRTVIK